MLQSAFLTLFDHDILPAAPYFAWQEAEREDVPGKMEAIVDTNKWLNWLHQAADEESDEESGDDSDDDSDEDSD